MYNAAAVHLPRAPVTEKNRKRRAGELHVTTQLRLVRKARLT